MLYKILLNALRVEIDPTKVNPRLHSSRIIESVFGQIKKSMGKVSLQQQANASKTQMNPPTSEMITAHTTKSRQKPSGKKKGRNNKNTIGANPSTNDNTTLDLTKNETNKKILICAKNHA